MTNDGTWTYTYDAEGNLIKKSKGASAETWTYTYDDQNHLVGATDRSTDGGSLLAMATYVYDALGNRSEQDDWTSSGGVTTITRFAYDGQNVWADMSSSNQLQVRRMYMDGTDQEASRLVGTATSWYLPDREGTIRKLTDANGNLQDTITYDAYGKVTSETSPANGDRYKYTGRELDSVTALQYNPARYYDPATG
jgi:YD repeat-containing protein